MTPPDPIVLGTRGSQLALWQAHHVRSKLEAYGHRVEVETIRTTGDRVQDVPITEIGDEAVFTKELDRALLSGDIHAAVHSLKDVPTRLPNGLTLAAIGDREQPHDAFVAHPSFDGHLEDLPEEAVIATASLRRKAQLKAWRPDLNVVPVRGNVDSRLEKLDDSNWHGMVLAVAGLMRMGLSARIRQHIPVDIMVPAVGQGALGIACMIDESVHSVLRDVLHHEATGWMAAAERGFLREVGGGCQVPMGAWARMDSEVDDPTLVVDACIAALDGSELYRDRRRCTPENAEATGREMAHDLLAEGGAEVLRGIIGTRTDRPESLRFEP